MAADGASNDAPLAAYIDRLDDNRREDFRAALDRLRGAIPDGYDETMGWGFPTFEVPLDVSGPTYNKKPLMFAALAAQKKGFSLYLMPAYVTPERKAALEAAFADAGAKLDMGKSCIRFTDPAQIPWDAIAAAADIAPADFVKVADEARTSGRC